MKRTIVISGGGTGIGLAAAELFAQSGDTPVLVGRRGDVLEQAAAKVPGAVAFAADLAEAEGARQVAAFVEERFGAVDVVVNSAGGNGLLEPGGAADGGEDPLDAVARDWSTNFRINVLNAALLTEALKSQIADGGSVLFLSSIAAYRGSGSGAYGAAKAALHPYAHDLARQLAPRGITVNLVAPGYTEGTEFFGDGMPEERRQQRIGETLNGRPGTTADIAETLRWLASPAARHITSQVIQVNGGAERGR
ncbi:SDR family oxidoreductase [Streptomyces sp. A7024]|uniref:SDR family oxidoreductase n=1 Tax=Streptomyces coryli TaxID=1128680 RepID=A0A6G4U503_9ACTN|nr:SDR family oxidoreductase [Streptomyces coryli]NGN67173.1 SDR family oxidoreductase [Streptomyces coryli]